MCERGQMNEWTKVVTHPLGLAGFALFLVFVCLARIRRADERRWLFSAAVVLSLIALVGGLGLAYFEVKTPTSRVIPQTTQAPATQPQTSTSVQQSTSGPGSPTVQGVRGNVTITIDQGSGKTESQKSPSKKDQQETIQ